MKHSVLFIMPTMRAGGGEKVMLHLLRKLDRSRFQPALFVLKREGTLWEDIPDDVRATFGIGAGERIRFHWPKTFRRLFSEARGAELMVGGLGFGATYLALAAGRRYRRPSVGIVHTELVSGIRSEGFGHRFGVRFAFPRLTRCVSVSQGIERDLLALAPRLAGKTTTIPNPLPVNEIRRLAAEPIPLPPLSPPIVIGAGRLVPDKGFDILIRTHAKLRGKGLAHSLVILGEGDDRPRLTALIRDLGVGESVCLAGFQKNPYAWMAKADMLAHCSRHEGFGMVLLEAMALGLPVVATDCPTGPREILRDGEYGALVPPDDENALEAAVARVLSDRDFARSLGAKAARRALDFHEDKIVPLYENLFLDVLRS